MASWWDPPAIEPQEAAELRRLRDIEQQFKRLQMEHDLLKKAIRFGIRTRNHRYRHPGEGDPPGTRRLRRTVGAVGWSQQQDDRAIAPRTGSRRTGHRQCH
jgi:hypothetical protein